MNFNDINRIAIGIRYQVNNALEDNFGKICDDILFTKNTPFSPDFFSLVTNEIGLKVLHNKETNLYLTLKNTDLIFDNITIKNEKDLNRFLKEYETFIFKNIVVKYEFKRIIRYGIIYKFIIDELVKIKKIRKYFCRDMYENVNQLDFKFSQKFPSIESVVKQTKKDFNNIIYSFITVPSKDELLLSIDYQEIYQSPLEKPVQKPIRAFFQRSKSKLNSYIFPWLDNILSSKG